MTSPRGASGEPLAADPAAGAEPSPSEGGARSGRRLESVDLLRGSVMVLMALDHVRVFFAKTPYSPTDLSQTSAELFLTRWVTHFCAPVFVFLAGTGAFLAASRGKTRSELARFLVTRGLWLVVLEVTVVSFAFQFDFDPGNLFLQVIWVLGWSMVVLAGLIYLPTWAIACVGAVLVLGHNLLEGVRPRSFGSFHWLWTVLHERGSFEAPGGVDFQISYPLLPWIGVMALGYAFGSLLLLEPHRRKRYLLRIGVALTAAFVVLRLPNLYGDPRGWSGQDSGLFTTLSFVNTEKYPPSLQFLLMTLGPPIAALALFSRGPGRLGRPLVVLGRVPLFFYLLHLLVIHALAVGFAAVKYGPGVLTGGIPDEFGYGLLVVYAVWIGVVILLYPACRWFAALKARRRDAWLSYL